MNPFQKIIGIAFLMLATYSCTCNRSQNQAKKEKEINASTVDVNIVRFEKELHACKPETIEIDLEKLNQKHKKI